MRHRSPSTARRQSGAALLAAMLTVMLVATFASTALWQQWRAAEIEGAERARVQAGWVLVGALDYSRLALAEDGRAGGADHLGELWAVPLQESNLTTFLAADRNVSSDQVEGLPEAFLSGRIVDAQSKLNLLSLIDASKPAPTPVPAAQATFTRLFNLLGLPTSELNAMVDGLQRALATGTDAASGDAGTAPLMPEEVSQLTWLGVSPSTAQALAPYVTILPMRTPLNLNTASAEAIAASVPSLSIADARRLVEQRARSYFKNLGEANSQMPNASTPFNESDHTVSTRYFEVYGRLRLDKTWVEEHSLLQRDGVTVTTLWRHRGAGATQAPAKP